MLKSPYKSVCLALLLMVFCSHAVSAQNKVYQYDGKLPFVQMMLNMMVAMGILDRLPSNGAYGNQFSRTPWQQTPWSSSIDNNAASPLWGSPSWGVLPAESYASNNSFYDRQSLSPAWSSTDLNGWVNETWEASSWNSKSKQPVKSEQRPAVAQSMPQVVQNFNYNVPQESVENKPKRTQQGKRRQSADPYARQNNTNKPSPLARLSQKYLNQYMQQPQNDQQTPPVKVNKAIKQKPCVTDFCGLKKPSLDGLWVAKNGEMLGVKNHRYLWSDSSSKYLTGQIKIQNEYLLANVDGYDKVMRFKYKLAGNHLLTLQPDGKIREFTRTRNNQSQGPYYEQRYGNKGRSSGFYYQ